MSNIIKRFLAQKRGNMAINGAILALPVMSAIGMTVDYSTYYNQKDRFQSALDAALLATAQEFQQNINSTNDELEDYGKEFFDANYSSEFEATADNFKLTKEDGDFSVDPPIPATLKITATMEFNPAFGNIIGKDEITTEIVSQVALGSRTVEVALVLDNSGSMSSNGRMTTLKTEATTLVQTIFSTQTLSALEDPVKFALVPFAATVNVGTDNASANWMDWKGWNSSHHEHFDWDTYRTSNDTRYKTKNGYRFAFQEQVDGSWKWRTRFDVFDMIGTEWGGCVEMRPWPHNVMDTYVSIRQGFNKVKTSMDADGDGNDDGHNSLFVPYFAPDEPDRQFAKELDSSGSSTWVDYDWDDDYYNNDYLYDFHDVEPSNPTQLYTNESSSDPAYDQKGSSNQVNRTNWMFKYQRNWQHNGSLGTWRGPNDGCTIPAITELTTNQTDVENAIQALVTSGTTNIQQGLTWGWRALSPSEPFTEGRDYDDSRNMKFLILLSDGNNYYASDSDSTPNQTSYGAWGYARPDDHALVNPLTGEATHNRWAEGLTTSDLAGTIYTSSSFDLTPESSSEFELIMNAHTNQACNNIKAAGITIYTVAFDVPSSGGVRDLLDACAGSGIDTDGELVIADGTFYYDVDQGGLDEAFESIASQIAQLRITN